MTTSTEAKPANNQDVNWQRLPLLALLFFFVRTAIQLVRNAMNLIPAFAGLLVASDAIRERVFLLGPLAIGAAIIIGGILQYWYFRYAALQQTIHIRQGVFNRSQLALEYPRIQQAEISQPFYFRPFDLAILSLDSAGSSGSEVKLAGIPLQQAQDLRRDVLAVARSAPSASANTSSENETAETDYEFTLPLREVLKYAFMDSRMLVLVPALVGVLFQFDAFADWFETQAKAIASEFEHLNSLWLWFGSAAAILTVMVLSAMLMATIRFYQFQLRIEGNRYQARSGLLSIHTVSLKDEKLQRVQWKQNWAGKLFSRWTLTLKQLGAAHARGGNQQKAFTAPVVVDQQQQQLNGYLHIPPTTTFEGVHWLSTVGSWVIWVALSQIVIWSALDELAMQLTAMVLSGIFWAVVMWLRWRKFGFCYLPKHDSADQSWLAVRTGFIGSTQNWYPAHKLQKVTLTQPPWQRAAGMATLTVYSAAGSKTIPWLNLAHAKRYYADILHGVCAHTGRWM